MKRLMRGRRDLRHVVLGVSSAICFARLGATGRAWAEQPGAFMFRWSAPEECPSQQQVAAEIVRLVGGEPRLHESELQADVTVSGGPRWSAQLTTHRAGRTGRRSLEAPSCKAVADAVALIIALSTDPDGVAAVREGASLSTAQVVQAPASTERRLRILASVHTQGRLGTSPGTDAGVGLGIGLAGARWRAELRWTYGLRRDQVAALPSGAAGRFNVATGSLTGCVDVGRQKLALGPCAVAEAGRVSATGYGATAAFSKDVPWLALGGGVFTSMALSGHLRASIEMDVLAPLYRPDYVFQDIPGVVFKAPPVGTRALVDVSFQF
jgi:hypothetical protein